MKKIGKWCLSVLLAVTLAMPAMAAQPVSSSNTEAAAIESQAEETAAETGESQGDVKETETSQAETKETETESESETETETETETEVPVDPIQELIQLVTASKPVLTSAKCTGFQLTVSWKKVSEYNPDGYYLYRKTGTEDWKRIATLDADKTSYVDTKAKYGTEYTYTLRAYKKIEGKDYRSGYDKTGVKGKVSPAAPKLTAKLKDYKSAVISWSKVNGAEEYAVYVKNASTGKWSRKTTVKGTSYTASAVCGQPYTYTVRALKKQDGKTVMSAYDKNGVTFETKLDTPVLKKAVSKQYNQINISWEKVNGAQKYYVYRKTGSSGYKRIGTTDKLNYTDSKASCGSTYTYTVRAYRVEDDIKAISGFDKEGKSATAALSTPILEPVQCSSVFDFEESGEKTAWVRWQEVPGADTYYVYRKIPGGKWSRIKTTQYTSFDESTEDQVYLYTVRAVRTVNGKKFISDYDKTGTVWVPPVSIYLTGKKDHNYIDWDYVEGAEGYRVYRKTGNGSWSRIATITGCDITETEYNDKNCKQGIQYDYTVRAFYTEGKKTVLSSYNPEGKPIVFLDLQVKSMKMGVDKDGRINALYLKLKNNTGKTVEIRNADLDAWDYNVCQFELYNSSGRNVDSLKLNSGKTSEFTYRPIFGATIPYKKDEMYIYKVTMRVTYGGIVYRYIIENKDRTFIIGDYQ